MATQQEHSSDSIRDKVGEYAMKPVETVKEYPVSSMMVLFGVGIGVGVAVALAMSESMREETTSEKWSRQLSEAVNEIKSAMHRGMKSVY